ncbi:MAG: pitrilysin family protein [Planctomycetales bacterium]
MRPKGVLCGLVRVVCVCGLGIAPLQAQPKPPAGASDSGPEHHAKLEVRYVARQQFGKGVTQAQLSNGLTVLVQENHTAPVATVRCFVRNTGSAYEGKFLGAGLSHLLEHLVAGGSTTKRNEKQVKEIMDSLGGQTNAYTSDEVTAFYIDCPASGVNKAIMVIAENMQFSTIPEAEFRREMGVVQRELEMGEADRDRVLYNTMKKLVYLEHPAHPTIGYISVVQNVKRDQVFEFFKDRYVPQNLLFVVVGDVKTDAILAEIEKQFQSFYRTTERGVTLGEEAEQASPRSTRLEMEGPTTHLALAWPTVSLQHPDLYALDVASYILSNGDSSRLVRRLKIERPLATAVNSASYTPGFVKGWFQVVTESDPAHVQLAGEIVLEEIERLKTQAVSAEELARAKRQKAADHVFGQQTVQNQSEILANSYLATGDPLFDDHYVEGIQKVTAAQIQAVARKYFVPQRMNTVRIEPLGTQGRRESNGQAQEAESPMMKRVLPNGLTVLLKRQTAVPMVSIQAYAKAGVVSDTPEKSGRASIATEMLVKGTKRYNEKQIAEYFDNIGGTLSTNSQRNSSYLQCSILKEDLNTTLDYVQQILFEPTFPAEEFDKLRQLQLSKIKSRVANPQTEIMDFWSKQLPADSPYHFTVLGDVETVGKLAVEDCKEFHSRYFVPGNMVLAIVGDLPLDETWKRIEAMFGSIPAGESVKWPTVSQHEPMAEGIKKNLTNQKANTAMVAWGFPIPGVLDTQTRAELEMLDGVVTGGGGAGGRLHDELRGARLVYYVFGIQINGFVPGYFLILAQTRPDTLPEVLTRIEANLKKVQEQGIPVDEFEKTRKMLLAAHSLRDTTAGEKAQQAALDELYGLGYDYDKGYEERLKKVTPQQVQEVARKYFAHGILATSAPKAGK